MDLIDEEAETPALPIPTSPGMPAVSPAPPVMPELAALASTTFVYAIGQIEARFPSLAVEKEFAQALAQSETDGQTDGQALRSVLSDRSFRYLARQMCWVLLIEGLETYLLVPQDSTDLELLTDALRSGPRTTDVDVVIGVRMGIATPEMCSGLALPIVAFDQIYSFDRDDFVQSIPCPDGRSGDEKFRDVAEELFDRIGQLADNAGATDEHRALNYLAVRYPAVYERAAQAYGSGATLSGVEVRRSRLSGSRSIVDVIFSYTDRRTDVTERHFTRVDVTEEFPFLVTKMSPFYDR
ncbi:hypothetical protein ACFQZ4_47615 [Catellatospora coxensis]|uniref:PatG C-terminal domain-containing protein n=1 Tax=Catellatospora coxensis TaxID=310354 RepID=A0A8J3P9Z8_9ACTN|nr:hypothetical protein [Catellatospora coxensis]GIG07316.1 hypothetical protein Cco03nite_40160 [Catellatospora coxensis]